MVRWPVRWSRNASITCQFSRASASAIAAISSAANRPARLGEQPCVQRALGDAGLGRRAKLRPRQIDLEEFVGRDEPAARVAIEQVVAAGQPEILVRRGSHDLPSIIPRGASMSAIRIVVLAILAFGAGLGAGGSASAQAYPSKPIHIVVPFAPGGITDILARALGAEADRRLGPAGRRREQARRARATSAWTIVAKSAPDGYTLVVTADASFVVNPHLYSQADLRPGPGFHPGHRSRHQPAGAGGASVGAGQHVRRADRARQEKARRAQLRHLRHRHQRPSQHRPAWKS